MSLTLGSGSALKIELRGRRLRRTRALRGLVRETRLHPEMLVQPLFIQAGASGREPIKAMPGQDRLGLAALAAEAERLRAAGIRSVLLFSLFSINDSVAT